MGRFWVGCVAALALSWGVACGGTTHRNGPNEQGAGGEPAGSGGEGATGARGAVLDQIRQFAVDKMDLLLVVDNSLSMADKQALLADAMPLLVQRLVTPRCIRPCMREDNCTPAQEREGIPTRANADGTGLCPAGQPELPPIRDLHVGVITSSLGSHGASGARDVCRAPGDDDHAHLLGELRGLEGTWNDAGFLAWDPLRRKTPAGDDDGAVFVQKFKESILAAGESGCGYESTLEAWYRFLIDPSPPLSVEVVDNLSVPQGVDQVVLDQRAQFLRPDSLVAIVMLTDENDCSIIDEGLGYTVATGDTRMFRGTSQCLANPNDHCCQSCKETTSEAGCPAIASDPECQKGETLRIEDDDLNLRCWQQQRRFGLDLLYPTSRYADALRSPVVATRSTGELVPNPLFQASAGRVPRDKSLVFLAGIVGVPWQDLADYESLDGPGLRYLTAGELEGSGSWDVILGQPAANPPVPPLDPLMLETTAERQGTNPVTGVALVPASSTNPLANPINGHEQIDVGGRDLQYACTFPLAEPRDCSSDSGRGCDCFADDAVFNRPLCQPPGGGAAGTTQYFAKAYPGLRHLEVLKALGDNAIVASTCPKVLDPQHPDYGYNPAINALVLRVREGFGGRCFPRELPVARDGQVPCTVVEALPPEPTCDCAALGREPAPAELAAATRQSLKAQQLCDGASGVSCASMCLCQLPQLSGAELAACQNDPAPPTTPGFCYVSAAPNETQVGNPALLSSCSKDTQRLIRFVGDTPAPKATVWLSCKTPSL